MLAGQAKGRAMDAKWQDEVLRFWFGELTPEDWYTGKAETDEAIRSRFLPLYREMFGATPDEAREEPEAALAAIIVYDQFPRNMFRGQPAAFASDPQALELARNAVEKGFDDGMPPERKQFLYMPFMHSEVLADQERCVSLFKALGNEENLRYAIEHRDIVARFGRFPHRNRVLERENSATETMFLTDHKGYGQ
jgi:uncharacterized protein (DUF924 family)